MNIRKMLLTGVAACLTVTVFATPVVLNLVTDDFPSETWFEMLDGSNTQIAFDSYTGPAMASLDDGFVAPGDLTGAGATTFSFTWDLSPGDYEFMIFDSFGDGICCLWGMGGYELIVDGSVVGTGGDYGSGMMEAFTVDAVVSEAGMLALFGLGLVGLGLARRKA